MGIDYAIIGHRIKQQRKKHHLTQEQLAEQLDVTIGYVSQMERGVTKINLDTLAKIATILQCDIAKFVSNTNTTGQSNPIITELIENCQELSPSEQRMLLYLVACYKNARK